MTAPLLAGWVYADLGHATPYSTGLIMIIVAAVLLFRAIARPSTTK